MSGSTQAWMYGLTFVALLIFAYGIWQMVHVWRMGRDWKPGNIWAGIKRMISGVMSHRKFMKERQGGSMHAWIFFGFLVLFIGTVIVAIDADFVELVLNKKLLQGNGYLVFELAMDLFGVLFIVGLATAITRRYIQRPAHIHPTTLHERKNFQKIGADGYALLSLLLIGVTGFLLEVLRIRHQVVEEGITHGPWSFVGNAFQPLVAGMATDSIVMVYRTTWWVHFALWTSILAILPWTKFKHIITSSLNLALHDPRRQSRPELSKPFDLPSMLESGETDMIVGIKTIRDFTWKDRLSFDACTNCGRCEAQCPAFVAGRPLSPRALIQDLKGEMWNDYRRGGEAQSLTENAPLHAAIQEATLWSCTTCRACVTACPVDIEHVDMIMDMRRSVVMESKLDENQQRLLVNLANAGNPYGFPAADRSDWRAKLPAGVVVPTAAEKQARGEPIDYLWWVGCSGSYDPRNQDVTRSVATIMNAAGVDFCILGNEERCNGDPARRLGEEGRFQQSVMENLVTLQQYGVKKIIAQCPHCLNTLQNEYAEFGAHFEVMHHTQLIVQLLNENLIKMHVGKGVDITYHDSCYLGRLNGIYDAPRRVLQKANGLPVLEMAQNRETGLCCGAGGGNMWFEVKEEKERINVIRAKQAVETGADIVVSACPFCLTMMNDGVSLAGSTMATKDLAEIVAEHLDWTPPEVAAASVQESTGGGGEWLG